jgi:stearoyl-CoA 9-desaturase NADPH oxidoreductase
MPALPSSVTSSAAASLRARPLGPVRSLLGSKFVAALAFPHSVDHYLELISPLWSLERIRAEVVEVIRETADVVTLVLRPNENFRGYQAGQYVALTVEVEGTRHTRCFSLSSTPHSHDGLIAVTIKARAQGGLVSPYLVQHARPGMRLELSAPQGAFVLPDPLPTQLLFISGGSGITPCMGMLRTLLGAGYTGQIVFIHYARSPADVIFGAELRSLAAQHENLKLVIETEAERGALPDLNEASLSAIVPEFASWDAWVCGPAPLMDAARRLYASQGAEARVRTEQFVLATPHVSFEDEAGSVRFVRSDRRMEGDKRSLLEQAEASGLRPQSGCRMGICQSCRCKKLEGVTRDLRTGELSTEDNVEIQLCISVPVGNVSLDL